MICKHPNDIDQECFEGFDDDGKKVYTCTYCGKQYNEEGNLKLQGSWKE